MKRKGFTLIEFIMSLLAVAIVAVALGSMLSPANNWFFILGRRDSQSEAQLTLERLIKEVERVNSPTEITTKTATHLTFTDISAQQIDIQLQTDGTNLLYGTDTLASNVTDLQFEYLDSTGSVTAIAADIRVIRISIAVTSGLQTVRMQTEVAVKNGV